MTETLYHYTDVRGLKGILEAGQIWFTDYRHLNDPSELTHGIDMARDVAHHIATGADGRVRLFLDYFLDLFRHDNFAPTLEFFIACFSRARDDLGQWRAYADNGRGVAIGLSPSLFAVADARRPVNSRSLSGRFATVSPMCAAGMKPVSKKPRRSFSRPRTPTPSAG